MTDADADAPTTAAFDGPDADARDFYDDDVDYLKGFSLARQPTGIQNPHVIFSRASSNLEDFLKLGLHGRFPNRRAA